MPTRASGRVAGVSRSALAALIPAVLILAAAIAVPNVIEARAVSTLNGQVATLRGQVAEQSAEIVGVCKVLHVRLCPPPNRTR